ncbi:hypothetical protein Tco_0847978 [Tanacetum coccineum]
MGNFQQFALNPKSGQPLYLLISLILLEEKSVSFASFLLSSSDILLSCLLDMYVGSDNRRRWICDRRLATVNHDEVMEPKLLDVTVLFVQVDFDIGHKLTLHIHYVTVATAVAFAVDCEFVELTRAWRTGLPK